MRRESFFNRLLKHHQMRVSLQIHHKKYRHNKKQITKRGADTFNENLFLMKQLNVFLPQKCGRLLGGLDDEFEPYSWTHFAYKKWSYLLF